MAEVIVLDAPLGSGLSKARARLAAPRRRPPTILAPLGAAALAAAAAIATAWIVIVGPGVLEGDRLTGPVSAVIGAGLTSAASGASGLGSL